MMNVVKWQEFLNIISYKKIICFGAGKRFLKLKELPDGNKVIDNIDIVVDNDISKQGKKVDILGRAFIVNSWSCLFHKNLDKYVILITIANGYYTIVEQLKQLDLYDKVDIYCLTHMLAFISEQEAMKKEIPENIKFSDKMLIPKTIHYCWFGKNPIPEKYKKWMESWKQYCPDYEIIEWNEQNYDITKNKYMYNAYKAKKWGFVPDYARLDIIYNHGGIYLDTDVELIANIDELLYQKGFAGFESSKYVNLGLGFGAQRGNRLIKKLMDDYNDREFIIGKEMIASPVIQTEVLRKNGLKLNGEFQVLEDIVIYPEKMLSGKNLASRRIKLKDYTKSIHHFDGSWLDSEKRKYAKELEKDINMDLAFFS